jgi:hypothetical protein
MGTLLALALAQEAGIIPDEEERMENSMRRSHPPLLCYTSFCLITR